MLALIVTLVAIVAPVLAFFDAHPWALSLIVWPLITGILSALFRFSTSEAYLAWLEKHPKLALAWRVMRALGIDVPKLIGALREYAESKRKAAGGVTSPRSPDASEAPPPPPPPVDTDKGPKPGPGARVS